MVRNIKRERKAKRKLVKELPERGRRGKGEREGRLRFWAWVYRRKSDRIDISVSVHEIQPKLWGINTV